MRPPGFLIALSLPGLVFLLVTAASGAPPRVQLDLDKGIARINEP